MLAELISQNLELAIVEVQEVIGAAGCSCCPWPQHAGRGAGLPVTPARTVASAAWLPQTLRLSCNLLGS